MDRPHEGTNEQRTCTDTDRRSADAARTQHPSTSYTVVPTAAVDMLAAQRSVRCSLPLALASSVQMRAVQWPAVVALMMVVRLF